MYYTVVLNTPHAQVRTQSWYRLTLLSRNKGFLSKYCYNVMGSAGTDWYFPEQKLGSQFKIFIFSDGTSEQVDLPFFVRFPHTTVP